MAENPSSIGLYTFCCVPKSNPRKGMIIVIETNENNIFKVLKNILRQA